MNPDITEDNRKIKIIKRYQNRKLYDTQQSCYVTLEDIAKMIRKNEEVKVIDNKTQNDITPSTLIQIIFESEKRAGQYAPLFTLREIIQHTNGSISGYLAKLGAFPKECIVKSNKPSEGENHKAASENLEKNQNFDNKVKQSLENRVAQAAKGTNSQSFGKLPRQEAPPSLPNSNKNFLNSY